MSKLTCWVASGLAAALLIGTIGIGLADEDNGVIEVMPMPAQPAETPAPNHDVDPKTAETLKATKIVLVATLSEVEVSKRGSPMRTARGTIYQQLKLDAEGLELLQGNRPPADAAFYYYYVEGKTLKPEVGKKFILGTRLTQHGYIVTTLLPGTDGNVMAVKDALAGKPVQRGPQPGPANPDADDKADIFAKINQGEVVFVARLAKAQGLMQTMSEPPTIHYELAFRKLQMLRGDEPKNVAYRFAQRQGAEPALTPGRNLVVVCARPQAVVRRPIQPMPPVQLRQGGAVQLQVQPLPAQPNANPAAANAQAQVLFLVQATEASIALAQKAVALPLGWTLDKDDKPLSPFAALKEKAWPKEMKFRPDVKLTCAASGRPALLAGQGIELTVEQVTPAKVIKFRNPYGDGEFRLTVTNTGKQAADVPALLTDGKQIFWADCLVIIERNRPMILPGAGRLTVDARPIRLEPGRSVAAVVNTLLLKAVSWPRGGSRVHFQFCLGERSAKGFMYYYSSHHDPIRKSAEGKPAVTPAPEAPAGDAAADAKGWIKLFADEGWYKNQAGREQEFTGKLEAIPQAGGFSTLMRTSYYKLGGRNLYTAAKKSADLDKLVGKQVVIRGKPYDIALEGRQVSEIWPAAVRLAK